MCPEAVVSPLPQFGPAPLYLSLESENRSHVPTDVAAFHLNRKEQTLRKWACYEDGPIRPIRINGRLAWRVADIRNLLINGN